MAAPPPLRRRQYRLHIPILSTLCPRLTIPIPYTLSPGQLIYFFTSSALYLLGPVLILVTSGLVYALSWTFWSILLPLQFHSYTSYSAIANQCFVGFIVINVVFNYIKCVTTRNSQNRHYDTVVRELARATAFDYPESDERKENWRIEWRELMLEKVRQKRLRERYQMMSKYGYDEEDQARPATAPSNDNAAENISSGNDVNDTDTSTSASTITIVNTIESKSDVLKRRKPGTGLDTARHPVSQPVVPLGRSWMWIGPNDWSYCDRTGLPKPPRSHFDHVTKSLVLNMDHFCPWMFNVVGYFNYRYFVNFLMYVSVGMMYGAVLSYNPFMMIDSIDYRKQISISRDLYQKELHLEKGHEINMGRSSAFRYSKVQHLIPNIPIPNEATPIAFCFMMCVAVGLSVVILLVFHLYLIATAQTTIEFHGNRLKKEQCKMRGEEFSNPYDLGLRRNMEQVWGRWGKGQGSWFTFWTVLLPSWRENDFLPVPFHGEAGLRIKWKQSQSSCCSEDGKKGNGGLADIV